MRNLTLALTLYLSLIAGLAHADSVLDLPELGNTAKTAFSKDTEDKLSEKFMLALKKQVSFVDSPLVNEYVQTLGKKLSSALKANHQPFHFFVVNNASINAFAGPGGHIGLNSGLFLSAESEDEVAAVLAHEIAHVSQLHIARQFEKAKTMSLPTIAGLVAAIALSSVSGNAATAALISGVAGSAQLSVNQIRQNEQEADRIGIQILAKSGFDPHAMPLFFKRMQTATRYQHSDLPDLIKTHPVTEARLSDAQSRADSFAFQKNKTVRSSFSLVQILIKSITTSDPRSLLREFKKLQHSDPKTSGYYYGEALCLMRLGELNAAEKLAIKLTEQVPDNLFYTLLLANIHLQLGNILDNIANLQRFRLKNPEHSSISIALAENLLLNHQPKQAYDILSPLSIEFPLNAQIFQLIGQAKGAQNELPEAFEARAEYFYLIGNPIEAVKQLKLALKEVQDEPLSKRRLERLNHFEELAEEVE